MSDNNSNEEVTEGTDLASFGVRIMNFADVNEGIIRTVGLGLGMPVILIEPSKEAEEGEMLVDVNFDGFPDLEAFADFLELILGTVRSGSENKDDAPLMKKS